MLPSFTSITGLSGLTISAFSLSTSAIRSALDTLIDIITNTMESIIRLISMFMQ